MDQKEPLPQEAEQEQTAEVAGLVRRVVAFMIDGVILWLPLVILGYIFREFAYSLGPYGRIIGYGLIIPYFGIFNSRIFKEQTIGKWVSGIVVVDHDKSYLSLGKSFGRAFTLLFIFMISQLALPIFENQILAVMVSVIVLGGAASLFYSIIFNRITRQGIHDLLVGSFVVKAPPDKDKAMPAIPAVHQALTYGLLGLGLVVWLGGWLSVPEEGPALELLGAGEVGVVYSSSDQLTSGLVEVEEWAGLRELQAVLLENDEFFTVEVSRRVHLNVSDSLAFEVLMIDLWAKTSCGANRDDCQALIMETAEIALKQFDNIEEISIMEITVVNRFDLGLTNGSFSQRDSRSIEDWQNELE